MRAFIRFIDRLLRRALGVYEFCDSPRCLLRIQQTQAPHALRLPGADVPKGAPVLGLHLWNEHVEPIPREGATLTWAVRFSRDFVESLHGVAQEMRRDPALAGVRAVGGTTGVLIPGEASAGIRVMERLGFTVRAYRPSLGGFAEFWENLFSWWLMWAYNPTSLRHRRFSNMARFEMWMAAEAFLERYGRREAHPSSPNKGPEGHAFPSGSGQAN